MINNKPNLMKDENVNSSIELTGKTDKGIRDQNHCCLCGTELTFFHKTNFASLDVSEKAHCKACGIQMKETVHKLQ